MNIFLTDPCPEKCARVLDDKRVVKMVLETAQMLSTNCSVRGVELGYRSTHLNHPCSRWSRSSALAFAWLVEHGLWLADEYTRRYRKQHRSESVIRRASLHRQLFDDKPLTFDFNSSGYRTGDVFHDYKLCLVNKWKNKDKKVAWRGYAPPWYKELRDYV